jgi:phosphocarrier protein
MRAPLRNSWPAQNNLPRRFFIRNLDHPGGRTGDAKSIVRVLAKEIPVNTRIEISAEGEDEAAAVDRLAELIDNGLGED